MEPGLMAQSVQCKNHSRRVLVADDDDVFRDRLVRALRERGWDVCGARTASEAFQLALRHAPGYALLDLGMTDASGLVVLEELRALGPRTRIVIFTGFGSAVSALDAVRCGANNYLAKPADVDEIIAAFELDRASVAA
jgi:two-component system response regulator RegA